MPDVLVATTFVKQETLFSCGPAVAQTLLKSLGEVQPVGPPTWQMRLWADVQAQTMEMRPANAGPGTPSSPSFPTQKCEKCPGNTFWNCWSTTPGALERVMNLRQRGVTFTVARETTERLATKVVMNALDIGLATTALVYGFQHWVVVDGYQHSNPNGTNVGGVSLNGVYIRNPKMTAAVHLVSATRWFDRYLMLVPCGDYGAHVVVLRAVRRGQ